MSASPLSYGVVLMMLSVVPLFLLALTSFIKFSVVFSILRSALGAGQLPSAAITSTVALILSVFVMLPVISAVSAELKLKNLKKTDLNSIFAIASDCSKPLSLFLEKHAGEKEREFFKKVNSQEQKENFITLAAAFVITELRESFAIGFALFIPFLVIDIVVANILVGMGMTMVSPITISVPTKIALFVLSDGWYLLSKSLILSYANV